VREADFAVVDIEPLPPPTSPTVVIELYELVAGRR
jgi:hypothetical protein